MKIILAIIGIILLISCVDTQDSENHMDNNQFTPRQTAIAQLDSLKVVSKFEANDLYTGLQPSENIPAANRALNNSIDRLLKILKKDPTLENILNEYKNGLTTFDELATDTEDREKVCYYYDEIREIIGFDSTNEILNDWLY
ncbi:MAG: hypothetical protein ACJAUJ_001107 [Salibacteraceae bacterium]|jgi:hypothetical protein